MELLFYYRDMKTCISITTYKKNKALIGSLESMVNIGTSIDSIVVSDDDDGGAEEVVQDFYKKYENGDYPFKLAYCSGPNKGIAVNKNRGIRYFLENNDSDFLVAVDDDIKFTKNALRLQKPDMQEFGEITIVDQVIKAHQFSKQKHITGFLEDYTDPGTQMPWLTVKPLIGEDPYCIYYGMSQGIFLFFTREMVELAGYMPVMPYRYGFEHILYSAACLRIQGFHIETFPILKNCRRYFGCQGIPNNYDVENAGLQKNNVVYFNRMHEIARGINLHNNKHGI